MTIGDSEPCDPSPRPPVRPSAGGHQHGAVYYDHTVFVPAWSGTIYLDQPAGAGAGAIAPEHNWADTQMVEAESPPVDTEHCWRCEVAAVSREDDVGLCDRCTEVLRDLTRPAVPDRGLQIPDASNGWLRIPFPPDVVMRSGEEFTFEVERDSAADAFRITVLTMNGILSQFTVSISSVLDTRG